MKYESGRKVISERGFVYEINIEHHLQDGFSIAKYRSRQIADMGYGRYILPQGDDDREWEEFESNFFEGFGAEVEDTLCLNAKHYFDETEQPSTPSPNP